MDAGFLSTTWKIKLLSKSIPRVFVKSISLAASLNGGPQEMEPLKWLLVTGVKLCLLSLEENSFILRLTLRTSSMKTIIERNDCECHYTLLGADPWRAKTVPMIGGWMC
jgi:hypothetical protein